MKIRHIAASLLAIAMAATLSMSTISAASAASAAPAVHPLVAPGAVRAQATVLVPNVVGENVGVAISDLQAAGFGLGFKQYNDNVCFYNKFEVIKQSPTAGSSVAPGSVVTLTFAVWPAPPRVCP
jgi:PASTA domain-containing protein